MDSLELYGDGGTDFRPAFAYVEELMEKREFENLKGLVYFTDGYGIFPAKMPPYRTAFVFMEQEPEDVDIPAWAMKLVITYSFFSSSKYPYLMPYNLLFCIFSVTLSAVTYFLHYN